MAAEPHEDPAFTNSVTYTVAVTVVVRGGARHGTADRRAKAVAERLANAAARAADVVDVTATAGRSVNGEMVWREAVRFAAANTGRTIPGQPDKFDRYLDPDHERALRSLAATNARQRARQDADRRRRAAVGCRNPLASLTGDVWCRCIYCEPDEHCLDRQYVRPAAGQATGAFPCVCGEEVTLPQRRCRRHRDVTVVALDGDPAALHVLADAQHQDLP